MLEIRSELSKTHLIRKNSSEIVGISSHYYEIRPEFSKIDMHFSEMQV